MNQFGEKIKKLRVKRGLLQREIAYELGMDTPMLSKIERGERNAKREQVEILCTIFKVPINDLLSLWLADKVYEVVKGEEMALKAMEVAEKELLNKNKIRKIN
jgi:transcriptional regulator with XRE-family HTH domain